jgi:signal transduction histidine kinase/CheY-like chemotaxis protein
VLGAVHVAWYVAIDLCNPERHVRRAAFSRRDGEPDDLPFDPYAPRGSVRVVHTGRAELLPEATRADLLGLAVTPADLEALRLQVGGYLCLPLRAHGRILGAMTFVTRRGEGFSPGDVSLAEEIARHAALAIDNARLYGELQDADRRKDEFLAMLGHELRNPLAAVVTTARNLLRQDGGHPDEARRMAEVVERQSARLVRLVDDLLDVSRVTRGKIALHRRRISLADVVARAVESTRPLTDAREHRVLVSSAAEPAVVDADSARIEQVVVNLLANAAKYTPRGGTIEVELGSASDDAILRVRDTGAGIPREQLERIFDPFTQLGTTPDRTDRGLGIGLALARSLVELHGGTVAAQSDGPGRGSEFIVRLPRAPATTEPAAPPDSDRVPVSIEPLSQRRRVLVVEDHPDVAAALKEELTMMGQDVRTAEDGPEALAVAREQRPDLMLIDIGLPGMDGFEVAALMRRQPELNGVKLVAVTGYGGTDVTRQCRAAGFDLHFTKPLSEETLLELLREE